MLKACEGNDIRDKRDKAIVVLFAETGLRAAGAVGPAASAIWTCPPPPPSSDGARAGRDGM